MIPDPQFPFLLYHVVKNERGKIGLDINSKKTEVMAIGKRTTPECNIFFDVIKHKQQQQSFKYTNINYNNLLNIWTLSLNKKAADNLK